MSVEVQQNGSGKNGSAKGQNGAHKDTGKGSVPTVAQLAAFLGVVITKALPTHLIQMFLKPLPAMSSLLADAAERLAQDAEALGLSDIRPEDLLAMKAEHQVLSAREAVAADVARRASEQRMKVDDTLLKTLFRIHKRVKQRAEDQPQLLIDWKFLIDFMKSYRPGRGPSSSASAGSSVDAAPVAGNSEAAASAEAPADSIATDHPRRSSRRSNRRRK